MALKVPFAVGAKVRPVSVRLDARTTKPPSYYTDGTLIEDMASAHKFVTDPRLRSVMKSTQGLGTERTRAAILDKCIDDGLLARDAKHIKSTPVARDVHQRLDATMKSPATTAAWEAALTMVEDGQATAEAFMQRQEAFVRQLVAKALQSNFTGCALKPRKAA